MDSLFHYNSLDDAEEFDLLSFDTVTFDTDDDTLFGSFWGQDEGVPCLPLLSLDSLHAPIDHSIEQTIGNITIRRKGTGSNRLGSGGGVADVFRIGTLGKLNRHVPKHVPKQVPKQVPIVSTNKKIRIQIANRENIDTVPATKKQKTSNKTHGQHTICKCKTRCLRGYCVCFYAGKFCSVTCRCTDSKCCNTNSPNHKKALRLARSNFNLTKKKSFCACKHSKCKKKYCICLAKGISCSHKCKCRDCENQKQ